MPRRYWSLVAQQFALMIVMLVTILPAIFALFCVHGYDKLHLKAKRNRDELNGITKNRNNP